MPSPVSEGTAVRVGVLSLVERRKSEISELDGACQTSVERDGSVLFERRTADEESEQYWGLLAGGKTADESTVDAAKREVREETGLEFHPERVVGVFDHESHYDTGTTWTVVALAGPADGTPDPDHEPDKRDRLEWFPVDDPPEPLHPTTELFYEARDADGLHPEL